MEPKRFEALKRNLPYRKVNPLQKKEESQLIAFWFLFDHIKKNGSLIKSEWYEFSTYHYKNMIAQESFAQMFVITVPNVWTVDVENIGGEWWYSEDGITLEGLIKVMEDDLYGTNS